MKILKNLLSVAMVSGLLYGMPTAAMSKEKIVVHIYPGSLISLYAHLGKDLGFYEKEGLSVELLALNSGPEANAALAGGSLNFVLNTSDNLLLAKSRGMDVVSIVGNQVRNFYSFVGQPDIQKSGEGMEGMAAVLDGKRIGVNAIGTNGDRFVRATIKEAGLVPNSGTLVPVGGPPSALAAFTAKSIDVAYMWEPFQTIVTMTGAGKILLDCRLDKQCPEQLEKPGLAFQTYYTLRSFLDKNPEAVAGFLRAHQNIDAWVRDPRNRDELVAAVKKLLPPPAALSLDADQYARQVIESSLPAFGIKIDRQGMEAWNEQLLDAKLIPRAVDIDEVLWEKAPR